MAEVTVTSNPKRIHLTVEKNSRGVNWTVSVDGFEDLDECFETVQKAVAKMSAEYGKPVFAE